jgi:hypothetical protein
VLQLNPGLTCPVSPPSEIILVRLLEGVDVCVIAGVLQQRPPHQRNSNAHGIIELVLHDLRHGRIWALILGVSQWKTCSITLCVSRLRAGRRHLAINSASNP